MFPKWFACLWLSVVLIPALSSGVFADIFGNGSNGFEIEFVPVGNPGNAADTTGIPNPAGSVPYAFRMGKYEISEQMIDKANALGGLGITKEMRGPDKPATRISWYEAAQFANWLNTSTGHAPAYKFDASGSFQLWETGDAGYGPANPYRNTQAKYFLPSADEWYKAAYYDPTTGDYHDYPTGSDDLPDGLDFAGDPDFDAVFAEDPRVDEPNDVTNVGVLSPYGTAGQGGNVYEWEETDYDLVNDDLFVRGLRGGAFRNSAGGAALSSSIRTYEPPWVEDANLGFRISSAVPEPHGIVTGITAVLISVCGASRFSDARRLALLGLTVPLTYQNSLRPSPSGSGMVQNIMRSSSCIRLIAASKTQAYPIHGLAANLRATVRNVG